MNSTTAKQPLLSSVEIGTKTQFPPQRRAPLNREWGLYYRYRNNDFNGFVESGKTPAVPFPMFQFITDFWRNVVVSADMQIDIDNVRAQQFVDAMKDSLIKCLRNVVADMVTYGVGVFDNRNSLAPRSVDPRFWFPVRQPFDYDIELGTVICYPYIRGNGVYTVPDTVFIGKYEDGIATERSHVLEGTSIGTPISIGEASYPIVDDMFVSVSLDDSLYGTSRYTKLIPQVKELHRRESYISESMDRSSDPHLAVPEGSVSKDASGNYVVHKTGTVIPIGDSDAKPFYVTYDASYDAQETAIKRLKTEIMIMDGISTQLLENNEGANNIPMSGAAMRRLAIHSSENIRAFWEVLTPAVKRVVIAQLNYTTLLGTEILPVIEPEQISIDWGMQFSVPEDENLQLAANGAASPATGLNGE